MTNRGILFFIVFLMSLLLIIVMVAIRNADEDVVSHGSSGYYIGTVTSIDREYVEIRVSADEGEDEASRNVKLRIDSYRFYENRSGVWNPRKLMPRIGEEYVFYYSGIVESPENAVMRVMPTRMIGEDNSAADKEAEGA